MKRRVDDCLVWTENELQFLETTADFKGNKAYGGVNLGCVKDKYVQILSIFVSNLSPEGSIEYFQPNGEIFHERSDCSQEQTASLLIQKSFRIGDAKWNW